jgi:capsular polysaccharide biosynthesis protein
MKLRSPDILGRLVRRFGLLVLLTVLGAGAGGAYGALKTPTFQAQSYVVATGEAGESIAALNLAQAYGRIATKGPVADKAATILGGRAGLADVTASTSPDTPVIEITATNTNAARAAAVANAVAQALVDFGNQRKTESRVTLAVLATASVPADPTSPKPPLELAVGAVAGLLIAGLAVLAGVGRPARRRADPSPLSATAPYEIERSLPSNTEAAAWYSEAFAPQFAPLEVVPEQRQPEIAAPTVGTGTPSINGDRIVGRAVVIYREQS